MRHQLFFRILVERRMFILGWTIGFIGFAALMVSFYPAMRQDGVIDDLAANMPKAFEGLIGNLANLKDFSSYLASQLFDIRLPLIAGIMAIMLGQALSTKEEEQGELRTLLALSISRTKVFITKWLALAAINAVAVAGLAIGIYATMPFVEYATLAAGDFLRLAFMTWLLMTTYGTIAFSVGIATGSRAFANFISILMIIGSFILSTFGQAVDWLGAYEKFSLLHYFPAVDIVQSGIAKKDIAVLVIVIVVLLGVALLRFQRRDIKG